MTHQYDDETRSKPLPRRRGKPASFWLSVVLIGFAFMVCFFLLSVIGAFSQMIGRGTEFQEILLDGEPSSKKKILLLSITGMIMDADPPGLLGGSAVTSPTRIRQFLQLAEKDPDVAGLLIEVNSPGGGVTASDTILREIRKFKDERNLPVAAYFKDVAASGGYYVSMAADRIFAHPTNITGSIGVIMRMLNYAVLYEKIGMSEETIISEDTPFKDMGSPVRPMKEEERTKLLALVQEMYDRFVAIVDRGRPDLTLDRVKSLANGSIYSASQAMEGGLVDEIGYRDDAITFLRDVANLDEDTAVVTYQRAPSLVESLLGRSIPEPGSAVGIEGELLKKLFPPGSGLLYLWPGWNQS